MSRVGETGGLVYLLWGNVSFWQEALAEKLGARCSTLLDAALSTAAGTVGRPSPTLALSTPPPAPPRASPQCHSSQRARNACQAPSPKYRGHPAAQFRAQSPTRPNNTMAALRAARRRQGGWQRWPTLADAGEGQQRLGEQDRCDDDGDAPRGGRGGHRSARSALLGAFDAARRVRRCSAHPALLGAARRCSARSALLGAFGAARRVRRSSARSALLKLRRPPLRSLRLTARRGVVTNVGSRTYEQNTVSGAGKHLRSVCAACELTVRAVAP